MGSSDLQQLEGVQPHQLPHDREDELAGSIHYILPANPDNRERKPVLGHICAMGESARSGGRSHGG